MVVYFSAVIYCELSSCCSSTFISQISPPLLSSSSGMIQRKQVVLSVLGELQEATESCGLDALTRVALKGDQTLSPFALPLTPFQDFPQWVCVDEAARDLYPADAPAGLLPLRCQGGGNLLFDAVSNLLVGSTDLSLELQVRFASWKTFTSGSAHSRSDRFHPRLRRSGPWWTWCCGRGTTCPG